MHTEKNEILSSQRRKAIIGLTAGASAMTVWGKPIVDAVMLPVHASTTETEPSLPSSFYGNSAQATVVHAPYQKQGSPLDWLVSDAYAGDEDSGGVGPSKLWGVKATASGEDAYDISILNPDKDAVRSGTLKTDGSSGVLLVTQDPCDHEPRDFNASISSVDDDALVVQFDRSPGDHGGFISITVEPGTGADFAVTC